MFFGSVVGWFWLFVEWLRYGTDGDPDFALLSGVGKNGNKGGCDEYIVEGAVLSPVCPVDNGLYITGLDLRGYGAGGTTSGFGD